MIYLDNNATTPVDREVAEIMHAVLQNTFGNPSSSHSFGMRAREVVEHARSQAAALIEASPEDILFTSGGTESNNLALLGFSLRKGKGHIITSAVEHPSVLNPCRHLESIGFEVTHVPVDSAGVVAPEDIRKAITNRTILITVMHANNETGVLQPIDEIGRLSQEKGIAFHTDAAQTAGKIPLSISSCPADMMTLVSHKCYGPKGTGALYVRRGIALSQIMFGAGHEKGLRPGTENVPSIAGFGKACEIARFDINARTSHTKELTEILYAGLKSGIDGIRINGHETMRLPNTLNVCIPGVDAMRLIERMNNSVAASSGSACHAGQRSPSPVLKAMGLSDEEALSSIRLSTGKDNTVEEIRAATATIAKTVKALRQ